MWDDITYPFPSIYGSTVEVWVWINDFIPPFIEHVIAYPEYVEYILTRSSSSSLDYDELKTNLMLDDIKTMKFSLSSGFQQPLKIIEIHICFKIIENLCAI